MSHLRLIVFFFFLIVVFAACEDEEGMSLDGIYVSITSPQSNAAVGDSVLFTAHLNAPDRDVSRLTAKWSSDKDGVLVEHPMDASGESRFNAKLSRNIHEITFEVNNGHGHFIRRSVTVQNLIQLKAARTGYGVKLEWTLPSGSENIKLFRSMNESQLKTDLPILKLSEPGLTVLNDTSAFLDRINYYQLHAEVNGEELYSNIAMMEGGYGISLDYPLMKVVYDDKRKYAYGIVSPASSYDNSKTGYGLVFINTATQKAEKRVLEDVRFNDLDIDLEGDRLYVSQRNRTIYVINLTNQTVEGTIALDNWIRKLEVGSNNRLYFQVEQASNFGYEIRIVDLVAKKELPHKGGTFSFHLGDIEIDPVTNTIYFSGPAKVKTTFDMLHDMRGDDCCDAAQTLTYRAGKLFAKQFVYDTDLNLLGAFVSGRSSEEYIYDVSPDARFAIGWQSLFNANTRAPLKTVNASYNHAIFLGNDQLMLINNMNPEYERYSSRVYFYPFTKK
jgi:hypothetical protein